ncbi:glycine-rich domain-containing protein [Domibacillus indicus]|uniref:hypothetical protein n=1 Tax=Domibacillus indicus TaxID=1437523 RepID=UPI000617F413|nr:hypothetical protein [Domibacillus indicus]
MFFIINYFNKRKRMKERESLPEFPEELRQTLGMRLKEGDPLAGKLEQAWNKQMAGSVKERLIGKGALSSQEYEWYELELKRFFCMTAIMKNVPMYSAKVDAIWHDMILFTKDYSEFCERFNGAMIHHTPTEKASKTNHSIRHERALYELVYSVLFDFHAGSEQIQGPFGNSLLNREFILECEELRGQELERYIEQTLFKADVSQHGELICAASRQIARQLITAKERLVTSGSAAPLSKSKSGIAASDQALFLLLYTSMEAAHEPEEEENDSAAGYACSGYDGRRYDDDRNGSHHDSDSSNCSSDSGGSSCSSCGGGCSS